MSARAFSNLNRVVRTPIAFRPAAGSYSMPVFAAQPMRSFGAAAKTAGEHAHGESHGGQTTRREKET